MSTTIWAACNSLALGVALLYICLFTLTIPHQSLVYVRLIIAPLAILNFWNFGYESYQPTTLLTTTAMADLGITGLMRVLEYTVVGFWDPTPPYWVIRTGKNGSHAAYPPPMSFRGRCFYAFDLLTSQRGASWSPDREWNWIPRRLHSWTCVSSRRFIIDGVKSMLIQYLLMDLLDTITKSRKWDSTSPYPISSLPIIEQSIFTMCVCGGLFLTGNFGYTMISTACVLCGSSPDSWAPMYDSPLSSTSLSDFWAHRWHWMFRRAFDRLSLPLVCIATSIVRLTGKDVRQQERLISVIRTIIIFWFSTLLHLVVMYRVAQSEYRRNYGTDNPPFWDSDILKFFMGQALGIFIESTIIIRVANWIFPSQEHLGGRQHQTKPSVDRSLRGTIDGIKLRVGDTGYRWEQVALTRFYACIFLIWTGRWGADMWVRVGFFREDEAIVPFSLFRGLWLGRW